MTGYRPTCRQPRVTTRSGCSRGQRSRAFSALGIHAAVIRVPPGGVLDARSRAATISCSQPVRTSPRNLRVPLGASSRSPRRARAPARELSVAPAASSPTAPKQSRAARASSTPRASTHGRRRPSSPGGSRRRGPAVAPGRVEVVVHALRRTRASRRRDSAATPSLAAPRQRPRGRPPPAGCSRRPDGPERPRRRRESSPSPRSAPGSATEGPAAGTRADRRSCSKSSTATARCRATSTSSRPRSPRPSRGASSGAANRLPSADRLGALVLVVREDEVLTPAVEVEALPEEGERHDDALGVPAGPAGAPRGRPRGLARLRLLPEGEVERRPLLLVHLDSRTRAQRVEALVGQQPVVRDGRDREIDAVARLIRDARARLARR